MSKTRQEFIKKSHATKPLSTKDFAKRGALKWVTGRPAAGEDGYVGIATDDTTVLQAPEDAIESVEAVEGSDSYRVGLNPEARVIISTRRVTGLNDCDCSDPEGQEARLAGPFRAPFGIFDLLRCHDSAHAIYGRCTAGLHPIHDYAEFGRCRAFANDIRDICDQRFVADMWRR